MRFLLVLGLLLALPRPGHACVVITTLPGIQVETREDFAYDAGMLCSLVRIVVGTKSYPDLETATPAALAHLGWADPAKRVELAKRWLEEVYLPASSRYQPRRIDGAFAKIYTPLTIDTVKDVTRARVWIDTTTFGGMRPTDNFTYVELEVTFSATGAVSVKRARTFEEPIDLPASACSAKPFAGIEVRGQFERNFGCTVKSVVIAGKTFTDHEAALKAALVQLGWKTATLEQRKQLALRWFEEVTGRFEHFHLVRTSPTWFASEAFHPVAIDDTLAISAWVDATRDDRVHVEIQHEYRDLVFRIDAAGALTRKTLRDVNI